MYDYDRSRVAVIWHSGIHSDFWDLSQSRTHWLLEETTDGSRFPKTIGFGDAKPPTATYSLPLVNHLLSKFDTIVKIDPGTIWREVRGTGDDSKPAAIRQSLVEASIRLLERDEQQLRRDGYVRDADNAAYAIKKVAPKLKWKKVSEQPGRPATL